jgi:hypothetical protein
MKQMYRMFILSCALALAFTSLAKLYSSFGNAHILNAPDAVLLLTNRQLLILVGVAEAVGAWYMLSARSVLRPALVCFFFSTNFLIYRLWNLLYGIKLCPCLGTLTDHLPIRQATVDILLWVLIAYMLAGSIIILVWSARNGERDQGCWPAKSEHSL